MTINELKNKKIVILGFAREGKDTLLFLQKHFPKKVIGVADQSNDVFESRKKHVKWHLGKNYLKAIKSYDVIIKSPGIPSFTSKKQTITSQTEIFLENCKGTVIGITGTKGKSTTASLIHKILKAGGTKAHLVGNIGKPSLQFLDKSNTKDVFVYELSSFQLENLKTSPHIAVFLNLYSEHLNRHGSFKKYAEAKANITKYQSAADFLFYNAKDAFVSKIAKQSKAQKIPFIPKRTQKSWIASLEPAILIGKLFGIPEKKIQLAIKSFKPLPHRLETIGKWQGITFINDSLATIPEATISAIDTLGNNLHTIILGGFDRGIDFKKLGKRIEKSKVKTLILFPTTGKKILNAIKRKPKYFFAKDMVEAIQLCYLHTPKGKICLLSPAASSFNMFRDYEDRGDQFKKFAMRYAP